MSDNIPSGLEGQIHQPNVLELLWEQHKKKVYVLVAILVLVVLGYYASAYIKKVRRDALWSDFARSTAFDIGYTTKGSLYFLVEQAQDPVSKRNWLNTYLQAAPDELISKLPDHVRSLDPGQLDAKIDEHAGTDIEPLLLWVAANRAVLDRRWADARAYLDRLETKFPTHFLCHQSPYPVQRREDLNKEDPIAQARSKKKADKHVPKLADPVPGSQVSLMRAAIALEENFREENPRFYAPPEPDPSPTVVVTTSAGQFKIRFYKDKAPKHVAHFVELFRKDQGAFYKGQRIDKIQRKPLQASPFQQLEPPVQFHFGLPASKDDDTDKWVTTEPSKTTLEFEYNDLSHFPGMVASELESDGERSSGERIWINANDCAAHFDGERVIFGRVVEGLDVIRSICLDTPFRSEADERAGQGIPQTFITIEKVEVLD